MKLQNKDLVHIIDFLEGLTVKGLPSINRTNLTNKIKEKQDTFGKGIIQLQKELKDTPVKMNEEYKKLMEQSVTFDDGDSKVEIESVKSILKPLVAEDSEHEFKDGDGIAIAALYKALELGGK